MMDKSTVQGHFFQQVANLEFQVSADYAPYYQFHRDILILSIFVLKISSGMWTPELAVPD